jgi:Transglutaminase-like superfamily
MTSGLLVRLYRLTQHERQLLAAAWVSLVVARLGLAVLPFRTLRGWAERGPWPTSQEGLPDPERAAGLVEAAARHHLLGTTCLTRALVLCRLLRRRGHEARLVVGCARPNGRFEAHAWIDCAGTPVTAGAQIGRFTPLLRVGDASELGSDTPRGHSTACSSTASMEGRDTG